MQIRSGDIRIFNAFERTANVIAVIARMLVGLGFAIALFLQVYMMILTDYRCEEGSETLGNLIRCTPIMEMIAYVITLLAGIGLAAAFFSPKRMQILETLTMLLVAVVINFLTGLSLATATWQIALVITALFAAMAGLFAIRVFILDGRDEASTKSEQG